ncbi:MAG: tail fiber domain-containing protein [Prevotella sp.]|nr:tail fiber domain-containing protein [Prevotella sp.]
MKKLILFAAFCCLCLTSNAQLKVDSDGKASIQKLDPEGDATLDIGDFPNSLIYDNTLEMGIHVQKCRSLYRDLCIGMLSESKTVLGESYAIGVWGDGTGASGCKNFGVIGTVHPNVNGVGVYGTNEGGLPPSSYLQGTYAGFFFGDTYVEGDLSVAYGFYNLSDMRLKDNVTSLRHGTLSALQGLDVFEYTLKRPNLMAAIKEGKVSDRMKKNLERAHYGVSAQELQKVYPNLVKEGQDGYLTVNYVEMVPLLLRCIQELKQESDSLKQEVEELKAMYDVLGGKSPIADGK